MQRVIPPGPKEPKFDPVREDPTCFGGKATLREATITLSPRAPQLHVLEVRPNRREKAVPVFVGLNFGGIHTLLDDRFYGRMKNALKCPEFLSISEDNCA